MLARLVSTVRLSALLGVLLCIGAACGASRPKGPPLSHEAFVKQMHSICRSTNRKISPSDASHVVSGKLGDPEYDTRLLREGRVELARLRKLNPPTRDQRRLRTAFQHWSTALDDFERLARAMETKDRAGAGDVFRALAAEVRTIARLIPDYPAGECLGEGLG